MRNQVDMAAAGISADTTQAARRRGELLRELGLMDEEDDLELDDLVELASVICAKPKAAISLHDEERQVFKSRLGFGGDRVVPLQGMVCQYTLESDSLLEVADLCEDDRFRSGSFQMQTGIRFYAGVPVRALDGTPVGTLCVMDTQPSQLTAQQRRALEILGRQASDLVQLRERARAVTTMIEERERGREMFSTILNNVPIEIYLKDDKGRIRFYNRKLANRFGISETEWLNKTSKDLWEAETARQIMHEDASVMAHGKAHESYVEIDEPGGRHSFWKSIKVPCRSMNGEMVLACCSVDITEQMERERRLQEMQDQLEEANRKLNSLSLTDPLTGLWNRRAFDARLETGLVEAQLRQQPLTLVMLDVDNFKLLNDSFGHPYGDQTLRNIANVMQRVKRAEDVACRIGGEEFAILMPGSNTDGACSLCDRLLKTMEAFHWEHDPVTLSMGIALAHSGSTADDMVDRADAALYQAKRAGKNCFVCAG